MKPVLSPDTDDFCSEDCRKGFAEGLLDEFKPSTVAFRFWRQYVLLQERFLEIIGHVDLSEKNLETYSDSLVEFIRSGGGEIDSICKTLLPGDPDDRSNMDRWRDFLENTYELSSVSLLVPRFGSYVRPFRMFALGKAPVWWDAYNAVKHRRATNFERATLRVALDALAALFVLNLIKLREFFDHWRQTGRISPRPYDEGLFHDIERLFYVRGTGIQRIEGGRSQLLEFKVIPRNRA
jgi:hypothetical protein